MNPRPGIPPDDQSGLLVIGRQDGPPTEEAVAFMKELLATDVYSARQKLVFPGPQIVKREIDVAIAEANAKRLLGLGVVAFAVREVELSGASPRLATFVEPVPGGLQFEFADGSYAPVRLAEIVSLCRGELSEKLFLESERSDPMTGPRASQFETTRARSAVVIDVHERLSSQPVRITQDAMQFARLYPERAAGSAIMMQTLWGWLREIVPFVPVYDDFARVRGALGEQRKLVDQTYSIHTHTMGRPFESRVQIERSKVFAESSFEAFQLYSALCRAQSLAQQSE